LENLSDARLLGFEERGERVARQVIVVPHRFRCSFRGACP
jgi:hypothetical protein